MSTGGFASRAFVEAGNLAAIDDIHVGEAAQGLSDAQQRPEASNWLPQVADIARRLPQITASQAALATIQAGTVNKLATPTAQQIAGAGGMAGFGLAGGTGGGLKGAFGEITGALGAARFVASTALGIADSLDAPGQARSGDAFSIWQSLQQESLSNMGPSGRLAGRLRINESGVPSAVRQQRNQAAADGASEEWLRNRFGGGGPNSHGGKPAQGN
jgi:hypothetical protein